MSREIKFRIWDRKNKCFKKNDYGTHCYSHFMIDALTGEIYDAVGFLGGNSDERMLSKNSTFIDENLKVSKGNQYEAQQWTGLTDKKGTPVYEGDIVVGDLEPPYDGEAHVGEIHFAVGTFRINGAGPLYEQVLSENPTTLDTWEVIGNIFENKDLLK